MALFSILYFLPYYQGYRFKASDQVQLGYMVYPLEQAEKNTGKIPLWTPNLFSGMPSYLIYHKGEGRYFWTLPELTGWIFRHYPPMIFFIGLLGFFLFLRVEGVSAPWATAGAIGFVLTSYYTNMIVATHWGKSNVLFSAPYVLAGMGLLHRQKWAAGLLLSLLGWAGMVGGHHPQMAYYALIVLGAYELHWLFTAWQERQWKTYLVGFLLLGASAGAGALSQISTLLPYRAYGEYSIRGGSELERDQAREASLRTGLDREYAQSYSASRAELWTLVIPDFVGGTSQEDLMRRLGNRSALFDALQSRGIGDLNFLRAMPTYWGGSPFSAGSFYGGVIWFFLALLGWMYGLKVLDWLLLYAAWIVLQLSLGAYGYSLWSTAVLLVLPVAAYIVAKRFSPPSWRGVIAALTFLGGWGLVSLWDDDPSTAYKLTDWALDYLPFYNKFRAPSTWLVTMGFLLVWMGIRGAVRFMEQPDRSRLVQALGISAGILLLVGWGAPWLGFSFEGPGDVQLQKQAQLPDWFMEALREDRIAIARQSALRSLLWLAFAGGVAFLLSLQRLQPTYAGIAIAGLGLLDGWLLNSRYFPRREAYIRNREVLMPPPAEPYERVIQSDTLRPFRILPLHGSPFTDARPSVYLESAGGYHPAKLKRYQQLIETHLSQLNPEVLRMLAIRYITARPGTPSPPGYDSLTQTEDGVVLFRSQAPLPMAWLSPFLRVYPRVDQTLDSLGRFPVHQTTLLAQKDWQTLALRPEEGPLDSTEQVRLLSRSPEEITYSVRAQKPRFLVLSEIYYPPDWKAFIDGSPTPIVPANFVLRGIVVPAGEHTVRLICESTVVERGRLLAVVGSIGCWLLIGGALALLVWKRLRG